MLIKTIPVGHLETNCYIVTDENTLGCAVIDPGDESNTIMDYLEDNRLSCKAILLTHGHYDHTGAVVAVAEETGAPVHSIHLSFMHILCQHLPSPWHSCATLMAYPCHSDGKPVPRRWQSCAT